MKKIVSGEIINSSFRGACNFWRWRKSPTSENCFINFHFFNAYKATVNFNITYVYKKYRNSTGHFYFICA